MWIANTSLLENKTSEFYLFFIKVLTYLQNRCIIIEHELSVEAECGYITTEMWGGGNFSGVCLG